MKRRILLIAVMVFCISMLLACGDSSSIDLNQYLTISYFGSDGDGQVDKKFDKSRFVEENADKVKYNESAAKSYGVESPYFSELSNEDLAEFIVMEFINCDIAPDRGLSKGDTVNVTWNCPDDMIKDVFGLDLKHENYTDTVQGFGGASEEANSTNESNDNKDVADSEEKKYELFPKSPEWSNVSINDRYIQIDDVMLAPGVKMSEFMDKLASSTINYDTSAYHESKLESYEGEEKVIIKRDGEDWIEILATNYIADKEAHELKDCVVLSFEPVGAARKCSYYLDGKSLDEIYNLSYSDVKDLDCLLSFYIDEKDKGNNIVIYLWQGKEDEMHIPNSEWTGYYLMHPMSYDFYINKDTQKVCDFQVGRIISATTLGTLKGEPITEQSQVEAHMEEIKKAIEEEAIVESQGGSMGMSSSKDELEGYSRIEIGDAKAFMMYDEPCVGAVCEFSFGDGSKKYVGIKLQGAGVLGDRITYRKEESTLVYENFEECEEHCFK